MAKPPTGSGTLGGGARTLGLTTAVALITALLCMAMAWLAPRPQGDLFLGLAGGRDVVQGKLGAPDEWSFASGNRVWIHQNWLGDLVLYAADRAGGETGLLVLKAVLLLGIMGAVTLAARERGVSPPVGILAAGMALAAWPQALILRANLFSLILSPLLLFLLYRSRSRPAYVWAAAALVGVWANTHGSFMFGIALMGLWAAVHLVLALGAPKAAGGFRTGLIFTLAAAVAAAVAGFANPFGLENLRVPLLLRSSEVWQGLTEWQPLFTQGPVRATTPWLFLGLVAVVVLGAGLRLFRRRGSDPTDDGSARSRRPGSGPTLVFETLLAAVLIVMAFRSQRFVLFAAVLLAPLAANNLQWILQPARRRLPALVLCALVLTGVGVQGRYVPAHYRPNNPARPAESIFGRMTYLGTHFPVGATAFLNENAIGGRVYNEWRWEGYLRWRSPQLELYAGGRAHQAYSEDTARDYFSLLEHPDPATVLASLDVHRVLVPLDTDFGPFCLRLLQSGTSPWVYLYCDQMSAVFVDLNGPGNADLLNRLLNGDLIFDDEGISALSRAMCLFSPALKAPPDRSMAALDHALRILPVRFGYQPLVSAARGAGLSKEEIEGLLESHLDRLLQTPTDAPNGANILLCRATVARILDSMYDPESQADRKHRVREVSLAADEELKGIMRTYPFTTRIR